MLEMECYQILRVSESATWEEIKQAYRRNVQLYHPDVRPWDKNSGERFKRIAFAYKVLSEKKRQPKPEIVRKRNFIPFNFNSFAKAVFTSESAPVTRDSSVQELSAAELVLRFLGTENAFVKREVIKALRYKKEKEALRLLTKALKDADSEIRRLALQSIAYFKEPLVVYLIASSLNDADLRVRYEAIDALGLQGGKRAATILKRLTANKSFFVRDRAQKALKNI